MAGMDVDVGRICSHPGHLDNTIRMENRNVGSCDFFVQGH